MNQQQNNSLRLPEQNLVILVGRATRDSELRYTTSKGVAVCSFDIAISRRMRDASGEWKDAEPVYVPIVVWNEQAERAADRVKKGTPVYVEGRLHSSSWEDKETKKMRNKIEVMASRVQVLSRTAASGVQTGSTGAAAATPSSGIVGAKIEDDNDSYDYQPPKPQKGQKAAVEQVNTDDDEDNDIPF